MILLMPLPDELDRSYLGRLIRLNGLRFESHFISLMKQWKNMVVATSREVCCLDLLGRAAHMEISQFVRLHTTLPFRRAFTSYLPDLAHGSAENQSMLRLAGMRFARIGAYFCVDCVETDLEIHGICANRGDIQSDIRSGKTCRSGVYCAKCRRHAV